MSQILEFYSGLGLDRSAVQYHRLFLEAVYSIYTIQIYAK